MADEPAASTPSTAPQSQAGSQQPQEASQRPEDKQQANYKGAGSKDALKADLATERQARQELATELSHLKTGLAKALGIEETKATPEQLAEQLTAAQSEASAAKVQLAIYKAAPKGVDVGALLDSTSFLKALAGIDPADVEAIAEKVTSFVKANPRFRADASAGLRDAYAGGNTSPGKSMDDWLRGR